MPTTTERLAEIAHDLWREHLSAMGWCPGAVYDAGRRQHDALVPFNALDKHDRRQALLGIQALELEQQLIDSIWYERGPARLFTLEEMRRGLKVGCNTEGATAVTNPPPEPGEVVEWEVDGDGWLSSVTVLWPDGERSRHHPADRELRRYEEDPAAPAPDRRA